MWAIGLYVPGCGCREPKICVGERFRRSTAQETEAVEASEEYTLVLGRLSSKETWTMEFLYPAKRQFPFDDACAEIVAALAARNFDVPGLKVELRTYGSGAQRMRYVDLVEGLDYRISFGRIQRTLPGGRWNDTAAAESIAIPGKKIYVYEGSGPTLWLYVGADWEAHRERFLRGPGIDQRRFRKERTYLKYSCRHDGRRSTILHADNDLGREYDPVDDEPHTFRTEDVFAEFRAYLQDVVLPAILSHPPAAVRVDPLAEPAPIPMPAGFGPLFCFGEYPDARRIQQGQTDLEQLPLADRYGMAGGPRLLPTDVPNDGTVPEVAYDGFLWCGIGEVTPGSLLRNLKIPGYAGRLHDRFVIRVSPRSADGVYVADHAPYDRRRKELSDAIKAVSKESGKAPRGQYTGAEICDFLRARARTIVPVAEYQGDFAEPVVLIRRELGIDEVEVVGGEHRD